MPCSCGRLPPLVLVASLLLSVPAGPTAAAGAGTRASPSPSAQADTSKPAADAYSGDPYRSRLLFSSTARAMSPGEIEVSTIAFALPLAAVGITPSLRVEAGLSLAAPSVFANPTVQVWSRGRWALALDARTVLAERDAGVLGNRTRVWEIGTVPQVIGTARFPPASVTLGIGIPWNTMGFSLKDPGRAFDREATLRLTAGGDLKAASWLTLLTENYLYVGVVSKEIADSDFLSPSSGFLSEGASIVESLNGARIHAAGLALDVAVGIDTEGPLFANDVTEVFPYLRLSYRL